jgi:hypothetical protein
MKAIAVALMAAGMVVYAIAPGVKPSDSPPHAWATIGLFVAGLIVAVVGR